MDSRPQYGRPLVQERHAVTQRTGRAIRASIIVPVHNNPRDLDECLKALLMQCGPDSEIVVVDDASTDETWSVAARAGVPLLRLPTNSGPAAARNHGANYARGDILVFVDADVVVEPDTVDRILKRFADHPEVAAVFGSYDATPRAAGLVSRYRNLLHHFVHQNGRTDASTFWAGCGAIRREVFQAIGGFDEKRFPRPSIEDIELGHRLRRAGHRIVLDKTIRGTHLKRWTFGSLVRTDIIGRAIPWSRLTLQTKAIPDALNLAWSQRVSCALVAVACASLLMAGFQFQLAALTALSLAAVLVLNRKLYMFFFRQGGLGFAVACVALHLLYFVYSGLSYLVALCQHRLGGQPVTRQRS